MANEGEFPKVDGDVLYASEVNNIYDGNFLSGIVATASGWDLQNFHLGSLTNYDTISIGGSGLKAVGSAIIDFDLGGDKLIKGIGIKHSYNKITSNSETASALFVSGQNTNGFVKVPLGNKIGENVISSGGAFSASGLFRGNVILPPDYSYIRYIRLRFADSTANGSIFVSPYEYRAF